MQPIMFIKVDFPEPEGPVTATNSPGYTSSEIPRSARTWFCPILYVLVRSLTFTNGTALTSCGRFALSTSTVEYSVRCDDTATFFSFLDCARQCERLI